ncbi:RIC1-domain-containing protein [Clavulina sp. PMI_390]|nr:RIC1-domain-containing protein [Clavulina sp. PMI_390]
MYFPNGVAKVLFQSTSTEPILAITSNARKTLFLTLTASTLNLWSIRPTVLLASLRRTDISLGAHGSNVSVHWEPVNGRNIVIQTSASHLVLVRIKRTESTPYSSANLPPTATQHFQPGPGEALPLTGYSLFLEGVVGIEGGLLLVSPRETHILFTTAQPPAVQRIPRPTEADNDKWLGHDTWFLEHDELPWLVRPDVTITDIVNSRSTGYEGWISSDGCAYLVYLVEEEEPESEPEESDEPNQATTSESEEDRGRQSDSTSSGGPQLVVNWEGSCIYGAPPPSESAPSSSTDPSFPLPQSPALSYYPPSHATKMAFCAPFSLVAVGTASGTVHISDLPSSGVTSGQVQTLQPPVPVLRIGGTEMGRVTALEWTSDGYALAVGWEKGWAVYTVGGRCLASSVTYEGEVSEERFDDAFMGGVVDFMWAPGNLELLTLAPKFSSKSSQLFVLPFAKSAVASQQSPDNTRYGVLQVDSGVMIYRGADQPDMSIINPEADVWQHVKVPSTYLALYHPIRYASISNDGRLLAIAGRRGLLHWSAISGRWKMFSDARREEADAFIVRGGMVWFNHVLVAAVETVLDGRCEIRLISRDLELSSSNILHREPLPAPVVVLSLIDNSLLVYTSDNTVHHFLIVATYDSVKLRVCGSISFDGIIGQPRAVRSLSWMIPNAQKELGDPVNDLAVATILMLLGGRLILLRPRKVGAHEVKYDMQILHERIEFCWIHLGNLGIGALENSLWGFDGTTMRIWLDALTMENGPVARGQDPDTSLDVDRQRAIRESVGIPLHFYPVSCLMEKGVIIGVEHEAIARTNLPFIMFRTVTSTHLFLHHILSYHLRNAQLREAVSFAAYYQSLVFFAHALEILLHTILEADNDAPSTPVTPTRVSVSDVLPLAIEFLDHFESSLEVVVGCARKTEMSRWRRLFDIVGNPKELFETCLAMGQLKTAGSYLLVLHNLEQLDEQHEDAIRLLRQAINKEDWTLSRELLQFLRSIDESGESLRKALKEVGLLESEVEKR